MTGQAHIPAIFAALAIAPELCRLARRLIVGAPGPGCSVRGRCRHGGGRRSSVGTSGNGFFMNWTGHQVGEGFEFHILAVALALGGRDPGERAALSLDRLLIGRGAGLMKSIDLEACRSSLARRRGEAGRTDSPTPTACYERKRGAALAGCDLIVHAGDIGGLEVLQELEFRRASPCRAWQRGRAAVGLRFPDCRVVEVGRRAPIRVLHDLEQLDSIPQQEGWRPW